MNDDLAHRARDRVLVRLSPDRSVATGEVLTAGNPMSATVFLEFGQVVGLITGVWFGLVGWKLVPLFRPTQPNADFSRRVTRP
jgi:hypothetical protein